MIDAMLVGKFGLNSNEPPVVVYPSPGISILLGKPVWEPVLTAGRFKVDRKLDIVITGGWGIAPVGAETAGVVRAGVWTTGAESVMAGAAVATVGAAAVPDMRERARARASSMVFCISAREERKSMIGASLILPPFSIIAWRASSSVLL